jgi:hypothetical protein
MLMLKLASPLTGRVEEIKGEGYKDKWAGLERERSNKS